MAERQAPDPRIKFIVDNMHVGTSIEDVIEEVKSRIKDWESLSSVVQQYVIDQCHLIHGNNRDLYRHVMSGGHGYTGRYDRSQVPEAIQDHLDRTAEITGPQIVTLMRSCKVTIRALSERMGITMKRIRQVREHGLDDHHSVRDWIEGITGNDPGPIAHDL